MQSPLFIASRIGNTPSTAKIQVHRKLPVLAFLCVHVADLLAVNPTTMRFTPSRRNPIFYATCLYRAGRDGLRFFARRKAPAKPLDPVRERHKSYRKEAGFNKQTKNTIMNILYTAKATATGEHIVSSDGVLDFRTAIPKEMGGPGGAFTNPEQLFAAGYAACFNSALNLAARTQKIQLKNSETSATVGIGKNDKGGFGFDVDIEVTTPGIDRETGEKLIAQAHQICPYSNATRGNIDVRIRLV